MLHEKGHVFRPRCGRDLREANATILYDFDWLGNIGSIKVRSIIVIFRYYVVSFNMQIFPILCHTYSDKSGELLFAHSHTIDTFPHNAL